MNINQKLRILSDAAKYDNSCASSGSSRRSTTGFGSTAQSGICHTWSADGRCISLLKILLTNRCIYDCAYCINRASNTIKRASFTPEEIAKLTVNFYRRNYIEGLFLSSAVHRSPDHTMQRMLEALTLLRDIHYFNGYIHAKIVPNSSPDLVKAIADKADRVSTNVEFPRQRSLQRLAPDKRLHEICQTFDTVKRHRAEQGHSGISMSTQMIIGATKETDHDFLGMARGFYRDRALSRVYYSAYIPLNRDDELPEVQGPPALREHRLYQADWLMRRYNFELEEFLPRDDNLRLDMDPKLAWALQHDELFPVDITQADYDTLIRIPGIGCKSAWKIIRARQRTSLDRSTLQQLRVPLKRSSYFMAIGSEALKTVSQPELETRFAMPVQQAQTVQTSLAAFGDAYAW